MTVPGILSFGLIGSSVKRRAFITLLAGAAAWPLAARAQQAKRPIIGILGTATPSTWNPWTAAFAQRLRELGWIEGRNVTIEVRWADGRTERFAEIAAEFVRLKVDVILTSGAAIAAAREATSVIPIVFTLARDPVASGVVTSLARPGGNVTGLSAQSTELVGKRLELLREIIPSLRHLAVMYNTSNPNVALEAREVQAAARTLDLQVAIFEIRRGEDIAGAFEKLRDRAEALYIAADPLVIANRIRINTLALATRLPTMFGQREHVDAGGLIAYGADNADQFRRAGDLVDKILRGAKAGDLPIEQPTKFTLIINLTTAKTLGLDIPAKILALADEVIE
jgi:putative tryptophan/tyrosine transport system substrate-binding protein